jgi:hypothetical protein
MFQLFKSKTAEQSEETKKAISVINDPFGKDNVETIYVCFYNKGYGKPHWQATVAFKNGNTKGEQRTPNCDTFEEVLEQLKAVFKSVKQ